MATYVVKMDGHEIDPEAITNPLLAIAVRDMQAQLRQKLRGVRCLEHLKTPEVTILFEGGKQHVQVQGCCQRLVDQTMQALLKA